MIYYARPFSYNPEEASRLYRDEAEKLHAATKDLIVCTIPLTDYELKADVEDEIFKKAARALIIMSDVLIYKGMSGGIRREIEMAMDYGLEVKKYEDVIKEELI
jgi:hypothetical protein